MSMADATATVVQHVFARLIHEGRLSRDMFEDTAVAHDRMADETHIDDKANAARTVADVARLILALSDDPPSKPALRLVREPDTTEDV